MITKYNITPFKKGKVLLSLEWEIFSDIKQFGTVQQIIKFQKYKQSKNIIFFKKKVTSIKFIYNFNYWEYLNARLFKFKMYYR